MMASVSVCHTYLYYIYIQKLPPNLSRAELRSPLLYVHACLLPHDHSCSERDVGMHFICDTLKKLQTNPSHGGRRGGQRDLMFE